MLSKNLLDKFYNVDTNRFAYICSSTTDQDFLRIVENCKVIHSRPFLYAHIYQCIPSIAFYFSEFHPNLCIFVTLYVFSYYIKYNNYKLVIIFYAYATCCS